MEDVFGDPAQKESIEDELKAHIKSKLFCALITSTVWDMALTISKLKMLVTRRITFP